jgi:hypothetical protein
MSRNDYSQSSHSSSGRSQAPAHLRDGDEPAPNEHLASERLKPRDYRRRTRGNAGPISPSGTPWRAAPADWRRERSTDDEYAPVRRGSRD